MYRCDPYFTIQKIKLPDSMYVLPSPISPLTVRWPDSESLRSNQIAKLERQEIELRKEIDNVMDKLKGLGNELGVPSSHLDPLRANPVDVVVSIPVAQSVAPLAALYRLLCGSVRCSYRVVVHSSAASTATDQQREAFTSERVDPNPQLTLTIIWKGIPECPAPRMVVSAGSQVPVVGMANILRFIGRLFGPELCGGGSPLVAAQVDSWLDLVTYQVVNGSVRSQGSVVRQLNSRLGSSKWLAGESFTLADLYAFVTLCELTGQKIPGNVQKWAKRCLEMPALASLPGCSADHLFPTN
jgi:hypothetical protein